MEGPTPKGHSDGVWRKGRDSSNNFQAAWLKEMDRKLWLVDDLLKPQNPITQG
jgi:hypothetical protein